MKLKPESPKLKSHFPAWGVLGDSLNLSEVQLTLRRYGALSVALCLRRFPSTPCHCSFWFKGSFSQTSGGGTGAGEYYERVEHCSSQVVTLWIISYAMWFISYWRIFSFCSFVHTHMHASHTPCPDHLTRCHDKAGGSGAQLGAQGIET